MLGFSPMPLSLQLSVAIYPGTATSRLGYFEDLGCRRMRP